MNLELTNTQVALLIAAALWELAWKAVALWRAAKRDQQYWFAAMILVNSVGLLPILYLLGFSKKTSQ